MTTNWPKPTRCCSRKVLKENFWTGIIVCCWATWVGQNWRRGCTMLTIVSFPMMAYWSMLMCASSTCAKSSLLAKIRSTNLSIPPILGTMKRQAWWSMILSTPPHIKVCLRKRNMALLLNFSSYVFSSCMWAYAAPYKTFQSTTNWRKKWRGRYLNCRKTIRCSRRRNTRCKKFNLRW